MILCKLWEIVEDRGALCTAVHGVTKSQAGLSDGMTIFKQWGIPNENIDDVTKTGKAPEDNWDQK